MHAEWTFDSLKFGRNAHRALPVTEPIEPDEASDVSNLAVLAPATLEPFEPQSLSIVPTGVNVVDPKEGDRIRFFATLGMYACVGVGGLVLILFISGVFSEDATSSNSTSVLDQD